ncbi:MAG TPA: hypothetical protein VGQ90_05025 [Stellaceae bacterium]|jgi:hypothetical protein|nr:hypothetical protein [Stellaceae bacterium]
MREVVVVIGGKRWSMWIAVALGAAVVAAVLAAVANLWTQAGDAEISAAGWIAIVLGGLVTLALGIGLMALVFISSRRGYDEADRDRR